MFDGNHRSRRTVNLGGRAKRRAAAPGVGGTRRPRGAGAGAGVTSTNSTASTSTSTTTMTMMTATTVGATGSCTISGKNDLLEETKRLRMQRREDQRRQRAAGRIQRVYRGYRQRELSAAWMESRWRGDHHRYGGTNDDGNDDGGGGDRLGASVLNAMLRLVVALPIIREQQQHHHHQQQQRRKEVSPRSTTGAVGADYHDETAAAAAAAAYEGGGRFWFSSTEKSRVVASWLSELASRIRAQKKREEQRQQQQQHGHRAPTPPIPSCGRIVQAALGMLLVMRRRQQQQKQGDHTSGCADDDDLGDDCRTVLRHFLLLPEQQQQQQQPPQPSSLLSPLWRRLGGPFGFSLLVDCTVHYLLLQQQRQQQEGWCCCETLSDSQELDAKTTTRTKELLLEACMQFTRRPQQHQQAGVGAMALEGALMLLCGSEWEQQQQQQQPQAHAVHCMEALVDVLSSRATTTSTTAKNGPASAKEDHRQHEEQEPVVMGAVRRMASVAAVPMAASALEFSRRFRQSSDEGLKGGCSDIDTALVTATVTLLSALLRQQQPAAAASVADKPAMFRRKRTMCLAGLVARGEEDAVRALLLLKDDGKTTPKAAGAAAAAAAAAVAMQTDTSTAPGRSGFADGGGSSESEDDDDDDEHGAAWRKPKAVAAVATATAASHYPRTTKKELQTLSKLNRLYQQEWSRQRKAVLTASAAAAATNNSSSRRQQRRQFQVAGEVRLALELASSPDLFVSWGTRLFPPSSSSDNEGNDDASDRKAAARAAYLDMLADILQWAAWSGWKNSANSPRGGGRQNLPSTSSSSSSSVLTQLAFEPQLQKGLWLFLRRCCAHANVDNNAAAGPAAAADSRKRRTWLDDPAPLTALSVFCDLFSHSLVAMRDRPFLERHTTIALLGSDTTPPSDDDGNNRIMARDVVVLLRDVLYDLYWTRPVVAADVTASFDGGAGADPIAVAAVENERGISSGARGRLLLTGTKLWNALYERWCRLVVLGTVVCEESDWWFPRITMGGGGGGAVVNPRYLHDAVMLDDDDDDNDDDNDDNDDEDDRMDIDHDGGGSGSGNAIMDMDGAPPAAASGASAAADAEAEALADAFGDPKTARILTAIPQAVPFERRVRLFDALLRADKARTQDESADMQRAMIRMLQGNAEDDDGDPRDAVFGGGRERIQVHRDDLYEDSMRQLQGMAGSRLRRKVQVTFINQHGQAEAGIDGGGVFKEFLDDLITSAFSSEQHQQEQQQHHHKEQQQREQPRQDQASSLKSRGALATKSNAATRPPRLFTATAEQTLQVNPELIVNSAQDQKGLLQHYEFVGRVLGKAVYESILVEPVFCLPFLNLLTGKQNALEDLRLLDEEFYHHLTAMLTMRDEQIRQLGLTFEVTVSTTRTVELIPSGGSVAVARGNVIAYVHLLAHYRLNVQCQHQVRAFSRGFRDLIPAPWLRLFAAYELQKVVSGDDSYTTATTGGSGSGGGSGIDVASLRRSMQYSAGYHANHPVIQWFWETVEEMTATEHGLLLKFVTSCSRPPLLGFAALQPAVCIQQVRLGANDEEDEDRNAPLPTSSTCMNLLKLPNYGSRAVLRSKLLAAISARSGFELT